MGFNLKKGGNFTLAPAGTHPARCYMVVDLGQQPSEYMGQKKAPRQRIRIGFELPFNKHVFEEKRGEEPFTLSVAYTNTLGDKGALKPTLNAWRGRPLTDEDISGVKDPDNPGKFLKEPFSFAKLIGAPALITVVHEPKKSDGSMVAKITSIAKLPLEIAGQKIVLPPAILKPILYSIDQGPTHPDFKLLPEWIQEECAKCAEWSAVQHEPEDDGQPVGDGTPASSDNNEPF